MIFDLPEFLAISGGVNNSEGGYCLDLRVSLLQGDERFGDENMGETRHDTRSHVVVAVPRPAVRRGRGGRDIEREGLLHVGREERLQQPRRRLAG